MFFIRFLAPLALVLCIIAYLLLPWTDRLFLSWSEADLQLRSKLVFSTIEDDLPEVINPSRSTQLTKRFTQLAQDERMIGIGYCVGAGAPLYKNKDFPSDLVCGVTPNAVPEFDRKTIKGGSVLVARFPIQSFELTDPAIKPGYLIIVHDMSFAEKRSGDTRRYVMWSLFTISLLAAFITMLVARITFSRWLVGMRDYVRTGKQTKGLPRQMLSLTRDIQLRIREIEKEHQRLPMIGPRWSASTLFDFVRENLPSEQLITVSYRQPYAHSKTANGIEWVMPASGLVTSIEPIMKACKGTWIAVGNSDADRMVVDKSDGLMVPPDNPSYRLKRLWLSEEEEAKFYAGFANEGVWPLCNMAYVKPRFRAADWAMYQQVNQKFADAVVAEAKSSSPIVFIQDYHFALLPKLIREKLPNALIICFWHIPWPNSETFGILPWRTEFLDGLLSADIIGFHTQFICNNFMDCVDTYIESLIDREHNTVRHGSDFSMVRPYPISIAWPDLDVMGVPAIPDCRDQYVKLLGINPDTKIIAGVERLDYIKGIPERLRSYKILLEKNPEWREKVCFVQIASPSRSIIPAYADIDSEVDLIANEINDLYATKTWQPVHILKKNYSQSDVYKLYRAADVCVVSSLHDGMNLVAKEFVSARDDERGCLILSQFAGSSRELLDALIVNPYDEEGLAQSMHRALSMGEEEQEARLKSMRERVRAHNVFAWAAEILGDASNLHRRRQLNTLLSKMTDDEIDSGHSNRGKVKQ